MAPNSDMKLGDDKGNSLFTDILQTIGTLMFQVETKPRQKFQVTTPYLAATVKGTTFTVSVRKEGAAVHVTNGAVQVAARGSQRAVIVRPGQTGSVSSKPGAEVEVRKRESKSNPTAGEATEESSESGTDGQADTDGQAGTDGQASASGQAGAAGQAGTAADNAQGVGLTSALGTQTASFGELTNGFAGDANANANSNASANSSSNASANANANSGGNSGNSNSAQSNQVSRSIERSLTSNR